MNLGDTSIVDDERLKTCGLRFESSYFGLESRDHCFKRFRIFVTGHAHSCAGNVIQVGSIFLKSPVLTGNNSRRVFVGSKINKADFRKREFSDHVQFALEGLAVDRDRLAERNIFRFMNGTAHRRLPRKAVFTGQGHIACPRGVAAHHALGQHFRTDDGHFFRVTHALKTLVFKSGRNFLLRNVDARNVDDDRAGKIRNKSLAARIGDH